MSSNKKTLYGIFTTLSIMNLIIALAIILWVAINDFRAAGYVVIGANLVVVAVLTTLIHTRLIIPIKKIENKMENLVPDDPEYQKGNIGHILDKIESVNTILNERNITHDKYEIGRKALISRIAHDLRMPLTSIVGYAEAIEDGIACENEQQKYIQIILESAKHLSRLIDDLDVYSKNELGELQIYRRKLLCAPLLERYFMELYVPEHIEIDLRKPFTNTLINVDGVRFKQILDNLMSNAIKHAKTSIIVTTRIDEDRLVIEIQNDGDKVPERLREKIFDPFYMVSKKRDGADKGGSGLGLAIVKKLITAHNGKVYVDHSDGKYTKFAVEFPIVYI